MSFKNHKNLVVVAGVVAALLAGTVLLGGYAKSVPAKSDTGSQVKAESGCPMMSVCPAGRTEPCCAEDPPQDCCGKPCPPDCRKPCCAEEAAASGCAGSAATAGACCPAATDAATK